MYNGELEKCREMWFVCESFTAGTSQIWYQPVLLRIAHLSSILHDFNGLLTLLNMHDRRGWNVPYRVNFIAAGYFGM
jgi:hypothetical protein